MNKRTLFNLFKYSLAFGLLGWVVYQNWAPASGRGLGYVWQRHVLEGEPVRWDFLAAGLAVFAASVLLTLVRWWVLVRAQDLPCRLRDALRIGLIGFFFSTFLPGSVGGDIVKAAFLARGQNRRTVAVATVVMDRILALWGLIWFVALLGGLFWLAGALDGPAAGRAGMIVLGAALIVAVSVVAWGLLGLLPPHRAERFAGRLQGLPRVGGPAAEFWRAVWMYRCRPGSVALALAMSWVSFAGLVLSFYCCTSALWDGDATRPLPTLTQHFLIVPIGLVIMALPLFPGGAGIGELGFGLLYGWFGYDQASGILGSLVSRVCCWVLALACSVVYVWMPPRAAPAPDLGEGGASPLPRQVLHPEGGRMMAAG